MHGTAFHSFASFHPPTSTGKRAPTSFFPHRPTTFFSPLHKCLRITWDPPPQRNGLRRCSPVPGINPFSYPFLFHVFRGCSILFLPSKSVRQSKGFRPPSDHLIQVPFIASSLSNSCGVSATSMLPSSPAVSAFSFRQKRRHHRPPLKEIVNDSPLTQGSRLSQSSFLCLTNARVPPHNSMAPFSAFI